MCSRLGGESPDAGTRPRVKGWMVLPDGASADAVVSACRSRLGGESLAWISGVCWSPQLHIAAPRTGLTGEASSCLPSLQQQWHSAGPQHPHPESASARAGQSIAADGTAVACQPITIARMKTFCHMTLPKCTYRHAVRQA